MNNFANKYRGEIEVNLGEQCYTMFFSMDALLQIEEKFGQFGTFPFTVRNTLLITEILIKAAGQNFSIEDIKNLPAFEFPKLTKAVTKLLKEGFTAKTGDLEEEDEEQETGEDDSGKLPEPVNENEPSSKEDGIDG